MAVLEGYSPRECSALLGCPVQDVIEAKSLALQRLADRTSQEAVAPQRNSDETPWAAGFVRAQVA
jgi:DNA-directed RNA polymerase specialized sigma24 family protein